MADDVVYINAEEGSKRVMNNTKLYAKLLTKFKEDPSMGQIEAALADGDNETAKNCAHTLKGLAANLSLLELYKQCLDFETQLKNGSLIPGQIENLKDVYTHTILEADKVITQYV